MSTFFAFVLLLLLVLLDLIDFVCCFLGVDALPMHWCCNKPTRAHNCDGAKGCHSRGMLLLGHHAAPPTVPPSSLGQRGRHRDDFVGHCHAHADHYLQPFSHWAGSKGARRRAREQAPDTAHPPSWSPKSPPSPRWLPWSHPPDRVLRMMSLSDSRKMSPTYTWLVAARKAGRRQEDVQAMASCS